MRLPHRFAGPLRTARLVLRTMTADDVDDIHAYQSREDVCRYLPFGPRSRDEVAEKVAQHGTAVTLNGDRDYWELAVARAEEPGGVIGDVYFGLTSVANASAMIGWTLHPDFRGRGYMAEAAAAILDVAFTEIGVHRVSAELDARNEKSAALCRRLGMREEARFVEDVWFRGAWADSSVYAVLDREWAARRDTWEQRVASCWAGASDGDEGLVAAMDALAAQRPADDPVAAYERASARDFAGREHEAEALYRRALAGGLAEVDDRRAVEARVQLASTLRVLDRPREAVALLEELDLEALAPDRADWVRAFLALALAEAGDPAGAARTALEALANHLTQYRAVVAGYAAELGADD